MKDIQIKDKVKISFPTVFGTITDEGEGIKKYTDEDGWRFYVNCNNELCFEIEDCGAYTSDRVLLADLVFVTTEVYENYDALFK